MRGRYGTACTPYVPGMCQVRVFRLLARHVVDGPDDLDLVREVVAADVELPRRCVVTKAVLLDVARDRVIDLVDRRVSGLLLSGEAVHDGSGRERPVAVVGGHPDFDERPRPVVHVAVVD